MDTSITSKNLSCLFVTLSPHLSPLQTITIHLWWVEWYSPRDISTWNLWISPYLEDVIGTWRWAHSGLGWALYPSVLIRKRKKDTERRWYSGGRNWSDESISQQLPSITGNHQKLGKRHRVDSSSEPTEGSNSTNTLLWTSDLQNCGKKFVLLSHQIWGNLSQQPNKIDTRLVFIFLNFI